MQQKGLIYERQLQKAARASTLAYRCERYCVGSIGSLTVPIARRIENTVESSQFSVDVFQGVCENLAVADVSAFLDLMLGDALAKAPGARVLSKRSAVPE